MSQVRDGSNGFPLRVCVRHHGHWTKNAYLHRFPGCIRVISLRHSVETDGLEVERFLTALAVDRDVPVSTRNQTLFALLFLRREVLEVESPETASPSSQWPPEST